MNILWIECGFRALMGAVNWKVLATNFLGTPKILNYKPNKPTAKVLGRPLRTYITNAWKKTYVHLGEPSYCFSMNNMSLVPMCESTSVFDSLHPQRFFVALSGTVILAKSRSSVKREDITGMGERTFCIVP